MTRKLLDKVEVKPGLYLEDRLVMAPMVVNGSSLEGDVTEEDINYFKRRAGSGSILITGATAVGFYSNAYGDGLGLYKDDQVEGMEDLARTMKESSSKALVQLFHPGRMAAYSRKNTGLAFGPSDLEDSRLNNPCQGLDQDQIEEIIENFARATSRAIRAGFDGIEIHGANHYLIHQFFSKNTNKREDKWGGSLEKRASFPLAVVKRVKEVIEKEAGDDFILGYRFSPEEIHEEGVGFSLEDSLYLIDKILDLGLDYVHTSQFGPLAYKARSQAGKYQGQVINKKVREVIGGRALLMGAGDITSLDKAEDALNYLDLLAMGSANIVDPDSRSKLRRGEDIDLDITGRLDDLVLPEDFFFNTGSLESSGSVDQKSLELMEEKRKTLTRKKGL